MAFEASSAELFPASELRLGQLSVWLVLETPFVKDLAQNEIRSVDNEHIAVPSQDNEMRLSISIAPLG